MLDDAFEQTGFHSAQEMHLDGLSESSSSSEKMELKMVMSYRS